ncbi:MAG TPA: HAD-IIIA family hydrolase [Nocardioidaceae bacterium]|nr:HAD-IIIA family hydrolase [Nocardioidaceae bacterium]
MSEAPTQLPTSVVIPTVGRPSLRVLLDGLRRASGPRPAAILVVDDGAESTASGGSADIGRQVTDLGVPDTRVLSSGGRGPAAARNLGWRSARTEWVSFLDDDVVPDDDWLLRLAEDLRDAAADTVGSQGRVRVPTPAGRRPTDWERSTAGLADARWITADMSYRRSALAAVGGFDERFRRAFREDADVALRVLGSGGRIVAGHRGITHPVRPADGWVSLRQQAGNADDALMRRLHGPHWRERAAAPRGRRRRHLAVTAAGLSALVLAASGRRRSAGVAASAWLAGTVEFAAARILPGPRDRTEVRRMVLTSIAIPPAAAWHSALGWCRHRFAGPWRGLPDLVLFDRDGTLVYDVPYNGDPEQVQPVPGARKALDRLRAHGVRLGVVSNQSGVGTGRITMAEVADVNSRIEELLGPFETWQICPHAPDDDCSCRKPAPEMVTQACGELAVDPSRAVLVGDIGRDVDAAEAAGVVGILVPTPATRRSEVLAAATVVADLDGAVDRVLEGAW